MPLDFPASPTNGQQFTSGGTVWVWDSAKWINGTAGLAYAPIASPVFTGNPTGPTPAAGDADTSLATTAFVAAAVAPTLNDVGRNLIHNGLFNVAQRGAGPFTLNAVTLDRWNANISTSPASFTQASLPDAVRTAIGDEAAQFCLSNTFSGTAGAGDYVHTQQRIENIRRLAGKTVTVSFWATSSGTPKLGINILQWFGTGGSPSAALWGLPTGNAVTLSTAWTRYSTTFAIPSVVGKTLGSNGDHYNALAFWYSSGATSNANAGNIGVQSGTIQLWGVQLEIGTVATPLEKPSSPQAELADCQRFYQLTTAYTAGYNVGGAAIGVGTTWAVLFRAVPTLTLHSTSGSSNLTGFTPLPMSAAAFSIYGIVTTGGSATLAGLVSGSADL